MLTKKKQSAALLAAIKEYDANKWKSIGQKVGKPAKVSSTHDFPLPWSKAFELTIPGLRAVCEGAFWWEDLSDVCT